MHNRKEQLTLLGRFLAIVTCFILGCFITINANSIQLSVRNEVYPLLLENVYKIKNKNIDNINIEFRKMLISNKDISSIVLYKFISDDKTSMFTGQVNVTSESKDGTNLPRSNFIAPMVDSTNNIQEILLNKVHYDNITTIQLLCDTKYDSTKFYSCEKYKDIGSTYKSVVSIPIINNLDVGVVGYVMITLGSEYDNMQVQSLVNNLKPYLNNVQSLVN